jgi:hypothetical protein
VVVTLIICYLYLFQLNYLEVHNKTYKVDILIIEHFGKFAVFPIR